MGAGYLSLRPGVRQGNGAVRRNSTPNLMFGRNTKNSDTISVYSRIGQTKAQYHVGDKVCVFSRSLDWWFSDGTVLEILKGMGKIKVRYDRATATKVLVSSEIQKFIRPAGFRPWYHQSQLQHWTIVKLKKLAEEWNVFLPRGLEKNDIVAKLVESQTRFSQIGVQACGGTICPTLEIDPKFKRAARKGERAIQKNTQLQQKVHNLHSKYSEAERRSMSLRIHVQELESMLRGVGVDFKSWTVKKVELRVADTMKKAGVNDRSTFSTPYVNSNIKVGSDGKYSTQNKYAKPSNPFEDAMRVIDEFRRKQSKKQVEEAKEDADFTYKNPSPLKRTGTEFEVVNGLITDAYDTINPKPKPTSPLSPLSPGSDKEEDPEMKKQRELIEQARQMSSSFLLQPPPEIELEPEPSILDQINNSSKNIFKRMDSIMSRASNLDSVFEGDENGGQGSDSDRDMGTHGGMTNGGSKSTMGSNNTHSGSNIMENNGGSKLSVSTGESNNSDEKKPRRPSPLSSISTPNSNGISPHTIPLPLTPSAVTKASVHPSSPHSRQGITFLEPAQSHAHSPRLLKNTTPVPTPIKTMSPWSIPRPGGSASVRTPQSAKSPSEAPGGISPLSPPAAQASNGKSLVSRLFTAPTSEAAPPSMANATRGTSSHASSTPAQPVPTPPPAPATRPIAPAPKSATATPKPASPSKKLARGKSAKNPDDWVPLPGDLVYSHFKTGSGSTTKRSKSKDKATIAAVEENAFRVRFEDGIEQTVARDWVTLREKGNKCQAKYHVGTKVAAHFKTGSGDKARRSRSRDPSTVVTILMESYRVRFVDGIEQTVPFDWVYPPKSSGDGKKSSSRHTSKRCEQDVSSYGSKKRKKKSSGSSKSPKPAVTSTPSPKKTKTSGGGTPKPAKDKILKWSPKVGDTILSYYKTSGANGESTRSKKMDSAVIISMKTTSMRVRFGQDDIEQEVPIDWIIPDQAPSGWIPQINASILTFFKAKGSKKSPYRDPATVIGVKGSNVQIRFGDGFEQEVPLKWSIPDKVRIVR